ncbi:MAG: molybdenum cofactor guanylyltransferase [Aquificae bacterium]|nr:molybdenum cofactor guanylyltransferase [Aquificota bacterium]
MHAYLLAGGRSRRMGFDKALLPFGGKPLILHLYRFLSNFLPTFVVTKEEKADSYRSLGIENLITDGFEVQSPLAGIVTGLRHSPFEKNLFFAVDLPLLCPRLVEFLKGRPPKGKVFGIVPEVGGKLHFTAAVYLKSFLPAAEKALSENRLSLKQFLDRFEVVREGELLREGIKPECLLNLNRPEDLRRLEEFQRARWASS